MKIDAERTLHFDGVYWWITHEPIFHPEDKNALNIEKMREILKEMEKMDAKF